MHADNAIEMYDNNTHRLLLLLLLLLLDC